jgi:hypothetical protein
MISRFLLLMSVGLNLALAGAGVWLLKRPLPATKVTSPPNTAIERQTRPEAPATPAAASPPAGVVVDAQTAFDWSQVASPNLTQYVGNLRAIECPKEVIREIIVAVVNEEYVRRRHALYEPMHARFWELMAQAGDFDDNIGRDLDRRNRELAEERSERLAAVLGTEWKEAADAPVRVNDYYRTMFSYLPAEKLQQLSQLDDSFNERQREIYRQTRANTPEQKAQLEALTREQDAARRQLLTAEEFEEYTARLSSRGSWAQHLAGFEATESEYRALNQLRAATPTNQVSQFNAQARELLGEERFASFQRGQDGRYAEVLGLAERCQLPGPIVEQLYQVRVAAEQQCSLVRSNTALAAGDRRALLAAVQTETRQQLMTTLGKTAGEAYIHHQGNWLETMGSLK